MARQVQQSQLLIEYKDLFNLAEISDKFFLVGQRIRCPFGKNDALFGSLFFSFISSCAEQFDYTSIDDVRQCMNFFLNNSNVLLPIESQAIKKVLEEIESILKQIDDAPACFSTNGQCNDCTSGQTCSSLTAKPTEKSKSKIEKTAVSLSNLEIKFFNSTGGNEVVPIQQFGYVASLYLMWKMRDHPQQQKERINTLLYSNMNQQNDNPPNQHQITMIGQLLNINCEVFQEFDQQSYLISLGSNTVQTLKNGSALPENFVIFSEDYSNFRYGYNTFLTKKQQLLIDKIYCLSDKAQVFQFALKEDNQIINERCQLENERLKYLQESSSQLQILCTQKLQASKEAFLQQQELEQHLQYLKKVNLELSAKVEEIKVNFNFQ